MNRRLALLFGVAVAAGAAFVLIPRAQQRHPQAIRFFDRRCRGGCVDTALLRVLPNGQPSQIANPAGLTTTKGLAVTCTRSTANYCRKSLTFDASNLAANPERVGVDTAVWTPNASPGAVPTATANAFTAPDGTLTAAQLVYPAVSSGYCFFRQNITLPATATYAASVYLYSATSTTIYISADFITYSTWSLPAGTWTRVSDTRAIASGANGHFDIGYNISGGGTGGTTGGTVYAWGARFAQESAPGPYVSPMLVTIPANTPRVEPINGLLVEGASTNLALHSQDFTDAFWTKIGSGTAPVVTADQMIAPDGTLTADQVVFPAVAAGSNYALIRSANIAVTTATAYTFSTWMYWPTGGTIYLSADGGGTYGTYVIPAATWTRVSKGVSTVGTNSNLDIGWNTLGGTGAGTGATVYLWQGQYEALPWASSDIVTAGSTVARAADTVSYPEISISQSNAQFYVNFTPAFSGANAPSGSSTLVGAAGGESFLYMNSADPAIYSYDGFTGLTPGGAALTAGTPYRLSDNIGASSRTMANATTGASGSLGTAWATPFSSLSLVSAATGGWLSNICVGPAGACK